MADDLTTYASNTWCPGCGNFAIFNAVKRAIRTAEEGDSGISRERIAITAGIGCHAKIFDYLALSGFYSIHGRAAATAQGMKLGNPDLKVIAFVGDGDSYGEGLAHLIFAAKRNADFTVIVHNNKVYGLTTGQFTPVSDKGFKGRSTPRGSIEEPLNPLALLIESGATLVARAYSGELNHLGETLAAAIMHRGFSFVDVLQPCVSFNNTYDEYNEKVEILNSPASTRGEAIQIVKRSDKIPIGIIYKEARPSHHELLLDGFNPSKQSWPRERKIEAVGGILAP